MGMTLREYLWQNKWRMSTVDFAKKVKMNPTHVSKVANGSIIPSMATAKKIEAATGGQCVWHEIMDLCEKTMAQKKRKQKI